MATPTESVARFLPVFMSFYEDHNKECPLTESEEFTSFWEIYSQRI